MSKPTPQYSTVAQTDARNAPALPPPRDVKLERPYTPAEREAVIDELITITGEDRAKLDDASDLYLAIRIERARELNAALPPRDGHTAPHADARDGERAARERMNRDGANAWRRGHQATHADSSPRPYRQPAPRHAPRTTTARAKQAQDEQAALRAMNADMVNRNRRGR